MLFWIFKNCMQINSKTSPSGNSNSPLTRTKCSFPWSKFYWNLRQKLEFPASSNCFSLPFSFRVTECYCIYWSPSADREESKNEKMRKKKRSHSHNLSQHKSQHCHSPFSPHSPTLSLKQGSDACGGGYDCTSLNGLILSSKNSLFQNKAIKSKTFLLKMSFSCMRI